jgi:hypothetical protein
MLYSFYPTSTPNHVYEDATMDANSISIKGFSGLTQVAEGGFGVVYRAWQQRV